MKSGWLYVKTYNFDTIAHVLNSFTLNIHSTACDHQFRKKKYWYRFITTLNRSRFSLFETFPAVLYCFNLPTNNYTDGTPFGRRINFVRPKFEQVSLNKHLFLALCSHPSHPHNLSESFVTTLIILPKKQRLNQKPKPKIPRAGVQSGSTARRPRHTPSRLQFLTNASGGIRFCLCSSVNANPARSKSQLVSSRHFRLHSRFMLLWAAIAWTICSLVLSSTTGGTTGATGIGTVATGAAVAGAWKPLEAGSLKALSSCIRVALLMWIISFRMQNPLPDGTITSERWNDRYGSLMTATLRSLKTPVTVRRMSWGCERKKSQISWFNIERTWGEVSNTWRLSCRESNT